MVMKIVHEENAVRLLSFYARERRYTLKHVRSTVSYITSNLQASNDNCVQFGVGHQAKEERLKASGYRGLYLCGSTVGQSAMIKQLVG